MGVKVTVSSGDQFFDRNVGLASMTGVGVALMPVSEEASSCRFSSV